MFRFNIDSNCLPSPAIPQQYIFCWKFNCRNPMQKPQTIYLNILISFRRNAMIDHLSFWDWVNYLEDSNLLPLCNWWDIHMSSGCMRALGSNCLWRSGMLKRLLREGLPLPAKYDSKTWRVPNQILPQWQPGCLLLSHSHSSVPTYGILPFCPCPFTGNFKRPGETLTWNPLTLVGLTSHPRDFYLT